MKIPSGFVRRSIGAMVATMVMSQALACQAPPQDESDRDREILKNADRPLDARIKAEKITENDLPPLPKQVVMPHPPVHRISEKPEQVPISAETWKKAQDAIKRGLDYLEARADARGGWSRDAQAAPTDQPDRPAPASMAITSLVIKAFVQAEPESIVKRESLRKALRLIRAARSPDGSFDKGPIANYVTASVLEALASIDDKDDYNLRVDAIQWLQENQWDQTEGLNPRQDWFGGAGYGGGGRPDLSNTQMMLDALYDAGLSPDEPAFQKALIFASRTQNLSSTNKAPWAGVSGAPPEMQGAGGDGGFVYTSANGGESMASETAGEGRYGEKLAAQGEPRSLRSYGSMTYAGFKSMLYAGLATDDVRVKAAFDWIRRHWTFDENPGMGQQGLYYYYHTMARALFIAQQDEITDHNGAKHNWREELIAAVLKRQRDDGSWVNEADRWMEGDPALVTAYSILALEEALKAVK